MPKPIIMKGSSPIVHQEPKKMPEVVQLPVYCEREEEAKVREVRDYGGLLVGKFSPTRED